MAQLLLTLAQVVVAVILAVISAYLGVVMFNRVTRDLDEWAEIRRGNVAMGIVLASIVLGIALILRPALTLPAAGDVGIRLYPVYVLLTQVAGLAVGLVLALAGIVIAVALFDLLTGQIDELAELQKGNVAVAVLMASVVLAVSVLMSGAIQQVMAWFAAAIM